MTSTSEAEPISSPSTLGDEEREPSWLVNRRRNARETLCCLPGELLLQIMGYLADDGVAEIYLVRQVSYRFADLFSNNQFSRYHEDDSSWILEKEPHAIVLQSLPLQAFRTRLANAFYSIYSECLSEILRRDLQSESSFPQSIKNLSQRRREQVAEADRVTGCWLGHVNACPHCQLTGEDIQPTALDAQKLLSNPDVQPDDDWRCVWQC